MKPKVCLIIFSPSIFYYRIQDLDGGFFERFGSLLQQQEIKHEETILAEVPQVAQCRVLNESVPENAGTCEDSGEVATDSGIENVESDSESEEGVKSVDFIEDVVGWNVSIFDVRFFYKNEKKI